MDLHHREREEEKVLWNTAEEIFEDEPVSKGLDFCCLASTTWRISLIIVNVSRNADCLLVPAMYNKQFEE